MNWRRLSLALAACTALAGCSFPGATALAPAGSGTAAASPGPALLITLIPPQPGATEITPATPTPPASPLPGATPTAPPTAPSETPASRASIPFNATVIVEGAKLRTGPGYLFPAASLLAKGTVLAVYGRSTGNEWIYVQTARGTLGWVFALLLQPEKDWNNAPGVEPGNALIVRGKVIDASGNPVNGIQFSLTQGTGTNAPRTDATTDASGVFTAFFPASAGGTWTVAFTAVSCTSQVMDQNCSCKNGTCGTIRPASMQFTFPLTKDLIFNWQ